MTEELTVQESVDGKSIRISGTTHPLGMIGHLIKELLAHPEDKVIRAFSPSKDVEIVVELLQDVPPPNRMPPHPQKPEPTNPRPPPPPFQPPRP